MRCETQAPQLNTAPAAASSIIASPVFLVGAERSGTTLLRLMLSNHPGVCWLNEFEYAVDRMPAEGGWPDLRGYHRWLATHRIFAASGLRMDPGLSYPELVRGFLEEKRRSAARPLVGATVHRHFDHLLRLWPDARFIHIVRDGRDVARSNVMMGWAGNVYVGVARWIEAERLWEKLRERLSPDRRLEVRYERLIEHPEMTLREISRFIGVDYSASMLRYSETSSYKPPDPRLSYQWRQKLGEQEIRVLEARIGDMLVSRGYELSSLPPLHITRLTAIRLQLHSRWAKMRFRQRRYGLGLWLAVLVTRFVRFAPLYRKVILKCNAIDTEHLK